LDGERRQPSWGDPSYRSIPVDIPPSELGVSHLHLRADDILEDMNILLPIERFKELAAEGWIGRLADHAYSFMGYQGFPADQTGWKEIYGPQVADRLLVEEVDCILLTAA
jgi:D-proline reductase (dithiol) PrdB